MLHHNLRCRYRPSARLLALERVSVVSRGLLLGGSLPLALSQPAVEGLVALAGMDTQELHHGLKVGSIDVADVQLLADLLLLELEVREPLLLLDVSVDGIELFLDLRVLLHGGLASPLMVGGAFRHIKDSEILSLLEPSGEELFFLLNLGQINTVLVLFQDLLLVDRCALVGGVSAQVGLLADGLGPESLLLFELLAKLGHLLFLGRLLSFKSCMLLSGVSCDGLPLLLGLNLESFAQVLTAGDGLQLVLSEGRDSDQRLLEAEEVDHV